MANMPEKDKNTGEVTKQASVTTPQFVSIGAVKTSFDGLIKFIKSSDIITNREYLKLILTGVGEISETEINHLTKYFWEQLKTVTKHTLSCAKIESAIRNFLSGEDDWRGRNYVGEQDGEIFIMRGKKETDVISISNFTLDPKYTVTVQGEGGNKYHLYSVRIKNDVREYTLKLKSEDFNKLDALQLALSTQLSGTSANINGCGTFMKDVFHKYVTLANFHANQHGTSLLGLERFENNGPKYFCSPTGIYGLDGKASTDIVFMGNEHSNEEELRNFTNLEYNESKWLNVIAPTFLRNIVHINDKAAMMSILGWAGAIPHDYVVRKEIPTNFFPHCHIIGEPGSGKSTIMTLVKQFMGHNDSSPRIFPTPFEVSKLLNSSYTIPVVLDEYGKRWDDDRTNKINAILVESFTRSRWSRGQSNLRSVYFKYKNPILMGGQIPTSDQALATRLVPVNIYKSFQNGQSGKTSFKHLQNLQSLQDKNFWVGFNIWCAKHTNEEVKNVYEMYRTHTKQLISDHRVAEIYSIVMLGLYYMRKLALELKITEKELGYNEVDILDMAKKLDGAATALDNKDETPLSVFLNDLAQYSLSVGNSKIHGHYFGDGLSVMPYEAANGGSGHYGRTVKEDACVFGRDMILVKVDDVVKFLNSKNKNSVHNSKEIMTFIEGEFRKSMQAPHSPDNLVLAPKQYKTRFGFYTAFNKDKLIEIHSEFSRVAWNNEK